MFFIKIHLIDSHAWLPSVMVSMEGKVASFGIRAQMWWVCSNNGAECNRLLVSETQINLQTHIFFWYLVSTKALTRIKQ